MMTAAAWEDFSVQGPFEECVQLLEGFLGSVRDRVAPQCTTFNLAGSPFALHLVATGDDLRGLDVLVPVPAPGAPPTLAFLPVLAGAPRLILLTAPSYPLGSVSRSSARQAVAAVRLALAHIARHRRGDAVEWPVLCTVHEAARGAFVGSSCTLEGGTSWQLDSRCRQREEEIHAGCGIVPSLRSFATHLRDEGSTLAGQSSFEAPLPDALLPTDRIELAAHVAAWCRALSARATICATWSMPPSLPASLAVPPSYPSLARLAALATFEVRATWHAAAGAAWTGPGGTAGAPGCAFDARPAHVMRASTLAVRAVWRHGTSAPLPAQGGEEGLPLPRALPPRLTHSQALVHILSGPASGGSYGAGWWKDAPPAPAAVIVLAHALLGAAALLRERGEEEERERELQRSHERLAALRAGLESGTPLTPVSESPARPRASACEPSCAGEVGASALRSLRACYRAWIAEEALSAVHEGATASLIDRVSADAAELLAPLRLTHPDDASDVSEQEEGGEGEAGDPVEVGPSPERDALPLRRRDQLMRHLRTGSDTLASVSDLFVDAVQSASLIMGGAPAMLRAAGDATRTLWWPHVDGLVAVCLQESFSPLSPCTRLALSASTIAIRTLHGFEATALLSDPLTHARVPASLREAAAAGREARLGRAGPDFFGLPYRSLLGWLSMGLRGAGEEEGGDRASVVQRVMLTLVAASWAAYMSAVRSMWESGEWAALVAALGGSGPPGTALRGCLLDQRLQLLAICVSALAERAAAGDAIGAGGEEEGNGFIDALPSPAEEEEEEDFFVDARSPDTQPSPGGAEVSVTLVVPSPSELAECGALFPAPGLLMPASGEQPEGDQTLHLRPVYAPRTVLPGPPAPSDIALVHARTLTELGMGIARGGGLGGTLSPALLAADMSAFKAANNGCTLLNFLHWYAPAQWVPTIGAAAPRVAGVRGGTWAPGSAPWFSSPCRVQAALQQGMGAWGGEEMRLAGTDWAAAPGGTVPPRGGDSRAERLTALWATLPPSARCKPVFSPSNAGEEALDALETAAVTDVVAQLLACAGAWGAAEVARSSAAACTSPALPPGHGLRRQVEEDGRAFEADGAALASAVQAYSLAAAVVAEPALQRNTGSPRRRGRSSPSHTESATALAAVRAADLALLPVAATRLALSLSAGETRAGRLRAVTEVLHPDGGDAVPSDVGALIAALAAAPCFTSVDGKEGGGRTLSYADFVREAPPHAGRVTGAAARFDGEARRSAAALSPPGLRGTPWGCQPSGPPFASQVATCPLLRVGAGGAAVERSPWLSVPAAEAAVRAVVAALPYDVQNGSLLAPVALSTLLESDLRRSLLPREGGRGTPRWPGGLPADAPAAHALLLQSTEEELRVCLRRAAQH